MDLKLFFCLLMSISLVVPHSLEIENKWTAINNPQRTVQLICDYDSTLPLNFQVKWLLTPEQEEDARYKQFGQFLQISPPLYDTDEIEYTCGICNATNFCQMKTSINLTLFDKERDESLEIAFLNTQLNARETDDAIWIMYVNTTRFPIKMETTPISYEDFKVDCFPNYSNDKVFRFYKYECTMQLKNLTCSNSRAFNAIFNNGLAIRKAALCITIYPRIVIKIQNVPDVYPPGLVTTPKCTVDAGTSSDFMKLALVEVSSIWSYIECDFINAEDCTKKKPVNISEISSGNDVGHIKSSLISTLKNFSPKHSGFLYCIKDLEFKMSDNSPVERARRVCMSEGPDTLTMETNPHNSEVKVGDTVELICQFSYCNFERNAGIKWSHDPNQLETNISEPITNIFGRTELDSKVIVENAKKETFLCSAQNTLNQKWYTQEIVVVENTKNIFTDPLLYVIVSVIFVLSGVIVYYKVNQRMCKDKSNALAISNLREGDPQMILHHLPLTEQASQLPFNQKWEFPRSKLKLGPILGSGFFGVVVKGEAEGLVPGEDKTTVAVKMTKSFATEEMVAAMVRELKIMSHLGRHENVVNLLGAVVEKLGEKELFIIVEICELGNLANYLLANKKGFDHNGELDGRHAYENMGLSWLDDEISYAQPKNPIILNKKTLVAWSYQIASGMEFLSNKKIVHGDLALRNILLSSQNIVKISDFGLSKTLYYEYAKEKDAHAKLPVKWMALESIESRRFSSKTDVWAFGITVWELFSLASTPYPEFESFQEIYRALKQGYRMFKPYYASEQVYETMLKCWELNPDRRPSFSELREYFRVLMNDEIITNNVDYVSLIDAEPVYTMVQISGNVRPSGYTYIDI